MSYFITQHKNKTELDKNVFHGLIIRNVSCVQTFGMSNNSNVDIFLSEYHNNGLCVFVSVQLGGVAISPVKPALVDGGVQI